MTKMFFTSQASPCYFTNKLINPPVENTFEKYVPRPSVQAKQMYCEKGRKFVLQIKAKLDYTFRNTFHF